MVSLQYAFSCFTVNVLKFQTQVACQKMQTNRADPDQTASEEAV